MADSQSFEDDLNDVNLSLFDFEGYYAEKYTGSESTLYAGPQASNDSQASNQLSSLEPRQKRVTSPEASDASYIKAATPVNPWKNSWGGSSMLVSDTGSESLHQYEQSSNTEDETAEIDKIEDKLKRNEMEH